MLFELYHKNIQVLTVEYDSVTNKFGEIISINNDKHIPVGIQNIENYEMQRSLQLWWDSRLIPKNRSAYKNNWLEIERLKSESFGFNLSDHYWIKPAGSEMTWEKGNFLTNDFSEDIGKYIVGDISKDRLHLNPDTPDLFSNGEQDKRWIIKRGKRLLLKYGKPPYYEQPFNEMLATEICRRFEIPHVKYSFVIKNGDEPQIYSSCPCFIDEKTEFIPAGFVQYLEKKQKGESAYSHLIQCCKKAGMNNLQNIEEELHNMLLVDYITGNVDRHYGNFGFLRDAETLEWKGVVPVFDTGNAMMYEYPTSDLRKSKSLNENVKCKSFASSQEEIMQRFGKNFAKMDFDFSKLKGIDNFYRKYKNGF